MTVGIWRIVKRLHTNSEKDDALSRQAGKIYFVGLEGGAVTFDYPGDSGSRTVAWPDGTSGSHLLDASPTIPTAHSQAQCSFTQIRE
jgi:hypothetical protein